MKAIFVIFAFGCFAMTSHAEPDRRNIATGSVIPSLTLR